MRGTGGVVVWMRRGEEAVGAVGVVGVRTEWGVCGLVLGDERIGAIDSGNVSGCGAGVCEGGVNTDSVRCG